MSAKSMPSQCLKRRQPLITRFIFRRYPFGVRIMETVALYQNETLTIEWGGLYRSETSALLHIETELGIKLKQVRGGYASVST